MAIQVYNHISVDLVFDSTIPSIDVMQGDTARGLIVTYLTEIDNLDNSDVSAVLKVQRADGMEGWAQGEVLKLGADMAQVVIDPSDDYTALIDVPGVAKAILEVYSGDTVVSTFRFRIDVKENPFYGTTIGSLTPKQLETVEQTAYSSAQDWMDAHPEASTTVQDGAITANKIANGAVTRDKIGTGSISATKLDTNSVIEAKIASNAVTTAKIKDSAVTNAKIASGVISEDKLAFDPFADLVFLGKFSGTDYNQTSSNIDISGYRALLLGVGTNGTSCRILQTAILPLGWLTDGPYTERGSQSISNNWQAAYHQGNNEYVAYLSFATDTTVKIASGGAHQIAFLYGIK